MTLESMVSTAVLGLTIYLAIGFIFALYFISAAVGKQDPVARKGSKGFRLLILPGSCALWPLLLVRQLRGQKVPPTEKNPHRHAALRGKS